jgi:hypothetical protein
MDAPAVAVSGDGKKVAIAWMDMRAGRNDRSVFWTMSTGGAFSAEVSAAEDGADIQSHPSLCIDAAGEVHIAFEDLRGGKQIRHRTSAKGSKDEVVTTGESECTFPSLACGQSVGMAYEAGGKIRFRLLK